MSNNLMQKAHAAPRCKANSKRSGQPCRAPAVKGWKAILEGANFLLVYADRPDQIALFHHWDQQKGPHVGKFNSLNRRSIALNIKLLRSQIGNVNDRFCRHHAGDEGSRIWMKR